MDNLPRVAAQEYGSWESIRSVDSKSSTGTITAKPPSLHSDLE